MDLKKMQVFTSCCIQIETKYLRIIHVIISRYHNKAQQKSSDFIKYTEFSDDPLCTG